MYRTFHLQDNNDIVASHATAQKEEIVEHARKRDDYVNYQQDMDATLTRNVQVI